MDAEKNRIYVLNLGENKKYIGRIDEGYSFTDRLHKYENGGGCKWVMKYGYLDLIEIIDSNSPFDEMNITLKYMKLYGIDNVRGSCWNAVDSYGKYSSTTNQINRMLESVYNCCHLCGEPNHYSYFCEKSK